MQNFKARIVALLQAVVSLTITAEAYRITLIYSHKKAKLYG